jgi:hypothetical protein
MRLTKVASNQIQLQWDDLPNEDHFLVQRSPDFGEPQYQMIATLDANVTTYTDNTVAPLNEYYYRVLGTNAVSQSVLPTPLIVATAQSPSTLPPGWNSLDIGAVGGPGAAGFVGLLCPWTNDVPATSQPAAANAKKNKRNVVCMGCVGSRLQLDAVKSFWIICNARIKIFYRTKGWWIRVDCRPDLQVAGGVYDYWTVLIRPV